MVSAALSDYASATARQKLPTNHAPTESFLLASHAVANVSGSGHVYLIFD
jgi:hypothetical protein